MDRFASGVGSRLESALGLRPARQRDLLGTLPPAVDRLRAPGGERHPDRVLVPQHRGQRDPLHVLRRSPRPGRYARLRAELLRLRAESLADPQASGDVHGLRPPVNRRDLCLAAAAGLATLLPFLGQTRDIAARELRHAEIAREMAESGDLLVPTLFGREYAAKPPVMHAMIAGLYRLAGAPSLALARVPSVVAGVAGTLAVYGIGWMSPGP